MMPKPCGNGTDAHRIPESLVAHIAARHVVVPTGLDSPAVQHVDALAQLNDCNSIPDFAVTAAGGLSNVHDAPPSFVVMTSSSPSGEPPKALPVTTVA